MIDKFGFDTSSIYAEWTKTHDTHPKDSKLKIIEIPTDAEVLDKRLLTRYERPHQTFLSKEIKRRAGEDLVQVYQDVPSKFRFEDAVPISALHSQHYCEDLRQLNFNITS
ncbi:MAG: hypothetical protein JRN67_10160 [Nitrososphaerota archaeon]|nr:hypothetical protein [Nitrososphaerota archaeon]